MSDSPMPTLSVSELNAVAKTLLEDYLSDLWIAGEVSNFGRSAGGHYYFLLKDQNAQVRCAMFKGTAWRFPELRDGDHVEVFGKIGIYEARGEFQITVSDVRMRGVGRLYEAYERLKARLQAEGLFDEGRKKLPPVRPRCIGIVTSPMAAALRDAVSTLRRRAPEIPLILYPAAVQGSGSGKQIAQAVGTASDRAEVDVLIVCRGGGSIEDLWAFNEEQVVRAVAACEIPVVSGIGHETDFTLTDFAADVRAPTPTAAAELASPDRAVEAACLEELSAGLKGGLQRRYDDARQRVDWFAAHIRHPRRQLAEQEEKLMGWEGCLRAAAETNLRLHHRALENMKRQLGYSKPDMGQKADCLNQIKEALNAGRAAIIAEKKYGLARQLELLEAVSPQNILARGFAVVRNSRGRPVRDAAELKPGQKLFVNFAEGAVDVQVMDGQNQLDLFDFP